MGELNGKKIMLVGLKGDSVFIRYSANADGTDFTEEHIDRQNYIGLATGQSAPTDKSGYTWYWLGDGSGGGTQKTLDKLLAEQSEKITAATFPAYLDLLCGVLALANGSGQTQYHQERIDVYNEHGEFYLKLPVENGDILGEQTLATREWVEAKKVFEKIATVTVAPDTDGTLPTEILINTDDNGQPFVIRDFFFVATATHTIEGASSAIVVVTGRFNKITKCQSGYSTLSMPKGTFRQYPITFNTYGKNCGMLKVGKNGLAEGMIFGQTSNYGGSEWYDIPTSPEVDLEEGINNVRFALTGTNYQPTEIAEGSKFELWGVRV